MTENVTAETRLIPDDIADQLVVARNKLRVAKAKHAPAWEAEILEEIDKLLDKVGRPPL